MEEKAFSVSFEEFKLKIDTLIKPSGTEWIIFLHGIQSNKELFSDFLKQPFLQKYSLLSLDLIGFGNSSKPETFSYDILDQANGHSLGGTIGTLMLEPLKDTIVSFINLEGNLTLLDSSVTKEVAGYTFDEFKQEKYQQIKESVRNSDDTSAALRSKCLEMIPDYVFYKTSLSIIKWVKDEDVLHLFADASCKRLYLYGDKNNFKKNIAPDSVEKVEIPNAGHFMLLDNPKTTYQVIEKLLNRLTQ
ncbi:MAG: hypothetical protein HYV38_01345 [Candidatus Levybacteria bacterium]|nr:hypothetical protein [Candidatus Levybacteria bacterium]